MDLALWVLSQSSTIFKLSFKVIQGGKLWQKGYLLGDTLHSKRCGGSTLLGSDGTCSSVFISPWWNRTERPVADFTGKDLFSPPDRSRGSLTTGFLCLLGLLKLLGRSSGYFAHVVSSISLTFCYLLKQSSLFSFERSVKWRGVTRRVLTLVSEDELLGCLARCRLSKLKGHWPPCFLFLWFWRSFLGDFFFFARADSCKVGDLLETFYHFWKHNLLWVFSSHLGRGGLSEAWATLGSVGRCSQGPGNTAQHCNDGLETGKPSLLTSLDLVSLTARGGDGTFQDTPPGHSSTSVGSPCPHFLTTVPRKPGFSIHYRTTSKGKRSIKI